MALHVEIRRMRGRLRVTFYGETPRRVGRLPISDRRDVLHTVVRDGATSEDEAACRAALQVLGFPDFCASRAAGS